MYGHVLGPRGPTVDPGAEHPGSIKREREDGDGKGGEETIIIKGVTSGDREADPYDVSQTR